MKDLFLEFSRFLESVEQYSKINALLDSQEFVFFFKFDKSVFGAPEESRIMYAKMKHPTADEKPEIKDSNFIAVNLNGLLKGEGSQRIFSNKDLKKIAIMDKDTASHTLGEIK